MRLYLAGADSSGDHIWLDGIKGLAFLVSYWYIKNGRGQDVIDYAAARKIPLFLDSGAFSAMTLGAKIDIQEYIDYCHRWSKAFEVIASLDVIGDWVNTEKNHRVMQKAGVNSIPCFHVREPFEFLERLAKENDYIALGVAGNQKKTDKIMAWIVKCFSVARKANPKIRFHGFGLTSSLFIRSFDWFSVDSSTWFIARRFAKVCIQDGEDIIQVSMRQSRIKDYMAIAKTVYVDRNAPKEAYGTLLRYNAETFLRFANRAKDNRKLTKN